MSCSNWCCVSWWFLEADLASVRSRAVAFVGTLGCSPQGEDKTQDEDGDGDCFCASLSGYDI